MSEPLTDLSKIAGWILCGSRWYGDAEEGSDFDYFRKTGPNERAFLETLGFVMLDHYHDRNTESVWEKENVHAILVYSEKKRFIAREIARGLSKHERKQTAAWNGIYESIKFLKEKPEAPRRADEFKSALTFAPPSPIDEETAVTRFPKIMSAASFPSTFLTRIRAKAPVVPRIVTQGGIGSPSTVSFTILDPRSQPLSTSIDSLYLRVRATNLKTLANSTNATIAATGGCTLQETHTSGKDLTFKSAVLTSATSTLTSNNTNVSAADTVTIGSKVYTYRATAAATGTLTSNNTAPSDGDTVTIGMKVYTFKTSLTPTEGQVLINSTADAALLNLIRAINHSGTPGTDYQCAAANPSVTAATSVTSHAFAVTAIATGTAGNSVATSKVAVTLSWGATTLTGGTQPTVEGDVNIGTNADGSLLNLIRAINHTGTPGTDYVAAAANTQVSAAAAVTSHAFGITANTGALGTKGNSVATTTTATTLSWTSTVMAGGVNANPGVIQFTVTDATAETITLRCGQPLVGDYDADYSRSQDLTHA